MDRPSVILDTNVFVAAGFRPGSASGRLVAAVRDGACRHVWHDRTLAETRRILTQVPRLGWAPVQALFAEDGQYQGPIDPDDPAFAVIPDPHDRKYAALAAVTGATVATGDDDLLGVRAVLPVVIRRPSEILRDLEGRA